MKSAFLGGDYLVQHYPWSKIYAESIKNLSFPFWIRYFHGGFPLMAEGQIGGFYPLNIIMFFALPFNVAYNYSVVLHFILGGIFTYIYSRKLGTSQWGGALAALLFCFGSAYAGCFMNTAATRTVIWFPLVLFLYEKLFETRKIKYVVFAGFIIGLQLLGGYIQLGIYSVIFYFIYFIYGGINNKTLNFKSFIYFTLSMVIAALIFLPQFIITWHLVEHSSRSGATLGFALWKSFLPPCFLSAFFPYWTGFLGPQIYIGVLSILFLIYGIAHIKSCPQVRPLILIGVVAIFVALGRYNPLYVAILKITRFYSFRVPSKFLFFALFTGSVLSGFGFSKFFEQPDKKLIKSTSIAFSAILAISLSIFFIAKVFLYLFKDRIILFLQDYVLKYIFGKPYHRYDLQTYMDKAHSAYRSLLNGTDMSNIFVISSVIMLVVGLTIGIYFCIQPNKRRFLRLPVFGIIFVDIFIYSFCGTGFRGNIKPFDYLRPTHIKILEVLKSDKDIFRILPFDLTDKDIPCWAMPNANALYGLDSLAAYTPLAEKDYKKALSPLEVVDDSLGLLTPANEALVEKYQLLRLLNVKYILTSRKLEYRFLKKLASDDKLILYLLKDYLPRIFFTYKLGGDIQIMPTEYLKVIKYRSGFAKVELSTKRGGFLVFSENYYPGWDAFVDGIKQEPLRVKGLIQAIKISKGRHIAVFKYKPDFALLEE